MHQLALFRSLPSLRSSSYTCIVQTISSSARLAPSPVITTMFVLDKAKAQPWKTKTCRSRIDCLPPELLPTRHFTLPSPYPSPFPHHPQHFPHPALIPTLESQPTKFPPRLEELPCYTARLASPRLASQLHSSSFLTHLCTPPIPLRSLCFLDGGPWLSAQGLATLRGAGD